MQDIHNAAIPIARNGVIIEGTNPIVCIFCKYTTCIEFDLDLHLYKNHRMKLVKLPIGKGSLDTKINYAIEAGKRVGTNIQFLTKEVKEKLGLEHITS